jgi:galactose mutarotase-like enzyme
VELEQFPYLGIWTANKPFDTGYICIEPWSTLPDATFVGRGLEDKRGIRTLAPGQSEELTYAVTFE